MYDIRSVSTFWRYVNLSSMNAYLINPVKEEVLSLLFVLWK